MTFSCEARIQGAGPKPRGEGDPFSPLSSFQTWLPGAQLPANLQSITRFGWGHRDATCCHVARVEANTFVRGLVASVGFDDVAHGYYTPDRLAPACSGKLEMDALEEFSA